MKELVDILVIAFAAITSASLQLGAGTLLLIYHEGLGRKVPKRVRRVTWGYIFGALLFSALVVAATMLIMLIIAGGPLNIDGLVVLISLAIAMSLVVLFLYYRRGKNTLLWIPDWIAKYLRRRAGKADTMAEGVALGMTTMLGELMFSLPLVLIVADSLLNLPRVVTILAIVGYGLITVVPLLIMKVVIRNGRTLVDIQRWRVKNKTFFRIFTGICYLAIAVFLIAFKLLGVM